MAGPYNADTRYLSEKGITPAFLKKLNTELGAKGLKLGDPLFIRILREEKSLEIWMQPNRQGAYRHFTTLKIQKDSGGFNQEMGLGPKKEQGDLQAAEGFYQSSHLQPNSEYHLAIGVDYPNTYDRRKGHTGGAIMIHGSGRSIGCFAIGDIPDARLRGNLDAEDDLSPKNNTRMNMLYALANEAIEKGQKSIPIHVFPFAMTRANMDAHARSSSADFWKNLKVGYDSFESTKRLPEISVEGQGERAHYAIKDAVPVLVQEPQPVRSQKKLISGP